MSFDIPGMNRNCPRIMYCQEVYGEIAIQLRIRFGLEDLSPDSIVMHKCLDQVTFRVSEKERRLTKN